MLQGLMQGRPLLISTLIEHAANFHSTAEIVSRIRRAVFKHQLINSRLLGGPS